MDILKKTLVLLAIMSVSIFMVGCGGDEVDDTGEAADSPAESADEAADSADDSGSDMGDRLQKAIEDAQ